MVFNAEKCARTAEKDLLNDIGMCLQQTRIWCDIGAKFPDASTAWRNTDDRYPGDRKPPRGAPVYWTGGSKGFGHIALSLGNGMVRSTDAGGAGRVATVDLGWVEKAWGLKYAGWAWDINDVTIPHLPLPEPEVEEPVVQRVVSWNMKVGRPKHEVADNLRLLIKQQKPQVICLQEAKTYIGMLRNEFGEKWWIYAHKGWDESRDNPIMVRKSLGKRKRYGESGGWGTVRTTVPWVGPKGGEHIGRTWTWVRVPGFAVLSLHRCTGGKSKNADQFKKEAAKMVQFLNNRKFGLIIGDHNCGAKADFPNSSKRVADRAGEEAKVRADGGIDYAIARNVKGRGSVQRVGRYGSDHRAVVFTVKGFADLSN